MVDQKNIPVVQTVGLCKDFKDFWRRPRVQAVKDLNLTIAPGEVFGLLGPNGSGKTTTIKMLLGLLYPTRGRISVFGRSPSNVAVKARIGFLPEESYLYRFLVARETLDYYGRLFRLPARVRRERTDRLLDMVGLRHEAKRPLGEYSKGMARRIGLAQALINDPEFLILDEPTSGLDPIGARQIKDLIRELGRKGKTILLSSHVLSDVEDVCDRVTILYGGQQRAAGDIGELLRKRDVTQITANALSEETVAQIRTLIRRLEGKDILEVSHPRQRLEDFFLKIVEEARAAKIVTSGAEGGGELPEFLQKPTASPTQEVVDTLISTARHQPETAAPIATPAPPPEPAREVLEPLLAAPQAIQEEMVPEPSSEAPPSGAAAPKAGEAGGIDALIEKAADTCEEGDEG
ncbi:MAG: ABC transporter ATP-binding protein [Planctomycetes bacterium]|nr:ABC transporter ATP-binding protein [Planctomycetota bacterium]